MASKMKMKFRFQAKAKALKQDYINDSIIRDLMKLPHNRKCINCNALAPRYVCTTFSTFVCLTCSGIHREFSHRVKSVSMATFTPNEIAALQAGGNEHAKKVYLSRWNSQHRLPSSGSDVHILRDFIKDTYVDKIYADSSVNCHRSHKNSDNLLADSNAFSTEEKSLGYGGEKPLYISRRNNATYEALDDEVQHENNLLKIQNDDFSSIKEPKTEQKLSRHLEELNAISDQLMEAIQPFELSDSPDLYKFEASPFQEEVFPSRAGSANIKDVEGIVKEPRSELEPRIEVSVTKPQSASSTDETSFSRKFQDVVLKMMEHKKVSLRGSKTVSEPHIPDGTCTSQKCQLTGEQLMTSNNWAFLDQPVQGKVCPAIYSTNSDSYEPTSTTQEMSESNLIDLDSLVPMIDWETSSPSNRKPLGTSASAPLTTCTSRKKDLTDSEALFTATFASFSWSQAPPSSESGERVPSDLETHTTSSNPFDVDGLPNFEATMTSQEEQQTNRSYSTRLLHSCSTLSNSSQFLSSSSSSHNAIPSEGPSYSEIPSTCTYSRAPTFSHLSLSGREGHESNQNDGYWQINSPFHHRLPARSKTFSFRENPFI